jgi:hypothetical protein
MIIDWRDRIAIIGQISISVIVIVGFVAVRVLMIFVEILPANQRSADTFDGAIIGAFSAVIGFWVGSSSGAQKANATIAQAATVAASTAATIADTAATVAAKGTRK